MEQNEKKGLKTTITAICIGVMGVVTYIFWLLGKLEPGQLETGLSSIAVIGSTVGLYLAKDADKTGTKK